jgi:hypothetical protein
MQELNYMAVPAAITAAKAAVSILTDEKSRKTVVTAILSIAAAVLLPIIMLLSLLTLPLAGLFGLIPDNEFDYLTEVRGQYGLDQYVSDADYLSGEGLDYSSVSFTDGQTVVNYYSQLDSRWKDIAYGDGTIGRSGCGPTSLAIVASSLTGSAVDPIQMAEWAYLNGYKAYGNGSYHSLIPEGAAHFGLTVDYATSADAQKIADALADGKLVIAIMSKGHFTKGGHFIVLRGVTSSSRTSLSSEPSNDDSSTAPSLVLSPNGQYIDRLGAPIKILVADLASTARSEQEWDMSIVLSEARQDAGAGGPFWILST